MTDLIARLETEVGTRELDGEIALLVGWKKRHKGWAHWTSPDGAENQHVPFFSTSLDDALTLVPEGIEWSVERRYSKSFRPAYASIWSPGAKDVDFHANATAATPALALCIAALKARKHG